MKMKKLSFLICIIFIISILFASCSASSGNGEPWSAADSVKINADAPDMTNAVNITLSGSSVSSSSSAVTCSSSSAVITKGGVYVVSGSLEDGNIAINAPGEEVYIVLRNAVISSTATSALYVYKSEHTYIYLEDSTASSLTSTGEFEYSGQFASAADEEPNACLYSKSDLTVYGAGKLTVSSSANGVTSKDNLYINNAALSVTADNNGINGKDSLTAKNASITVKSGADAVRSTNDSDSEKGYITLENCSLNLNAGEDGIQAQTNLTISGGEYNITCASGSSGTLSDDASAKGLKASGNLTVTDGKFNLDCADDAVHSNADIEISGGSFTISTGDDSFHADGTLGISGGSFDITKCYEGLEGSDVAVSGGEFKIVSSDDGINAAGGNDESGFAGGSPFGTEGDHSIKISGGNFSLIAGGDGIDSNGSLDISGGTIAVSSSSEDDGALDYDGTSSITGGTLFAESKGSVMAQAPSDCTQNTMFVSLGSNRTAGETVTISGASGTYTYTLTCNASNFVFSSPELNDGETYTVSCSGDTIAEITLESGLTTYGNVNSGAPGMGGGQPGGMGGGQPGGQPGGMGGMQSPPDGGQPGNFNR